MAMARVCDVCGELVKAPFKQLKVLSAEEETQEPRNYKTVKLLDMHEKCYTGFTEWLRRTQAEARKFRAIATIADEGVPAHGGPVK